MRPMFRAAFPVSAVTAAGLSSLDQLFDRVVGENGKQVWHENWSGDHFPVSLWADDDRFYFEAELPGVEETDLEVTVHGDILTINTNRTEVRERKYLYTDRKFGKVSRAIKLPEAVDSERIEATLKNGVLFLELPKRAEARPKKITIKNA